MWCPQTELHLKFFYTHAVTDVTDKYEVWLKVNLSHLQFCLRASQLHQCNCFMWPTKALCPEQEISRSNFQCEQWCEVETTHRWHTVSNLVHHGWNSLNCCEQTSFNYEKAQQGNFKCNYLHLVSLQVSISVTTTVVVVIYIFCS